MQTLLDLGDVHSGYRGGDILQGVSLDIHRGEIVAAVGRNGVGKTTLMKTIMGLLPTRHGSVHLEGDDITRLPAEARAHRGLGYVPQGKQIFPQLTVRENLRMGERINGSKTSDYDRVYAYFPILRERLDQRGGTLSGGQQQALAIGRALVGQPELLLLDEPSESIQPNIIQQMGDILSRLNRETGLTIILVEQHLGLIGAIAQRGYVLDKGRITTELSRDEITNRDVMLRHLAV